MIKTKIVEREVGDGDAAVGAVVRGAGEKAACDEGERAEDLVRISVGIGGSRRGRLLVVEEVDCESKFLL